MTELLRHPFTLIDGGLSTALEELGETPQGLLWTAAALMDRPELITEAHRRYVQAGADVVITALQDVLERVVAASTSAGQVRELTLHARLKFEVRDTTGRELIAAT